MSFITFNIIHYFVFLSILQNTCKIFKVYTLHVREENEFIKKEKRVRIPQDKHEFMFWSPSSTISAFFASMIFFFDKSRVNSFLNFDRSEVDKDHVGWPISIRAFKVAILSPALIHMLPALGEFAMPAMWLWSGLSYQPVIIITSLNHSLLINPLSNLNFPLLCSIIASDHRSMIWFDPTKSRYSTSDEEKWEIHSLLAIDWSKHLSNIFLQTKKTGVM